MALYSPINCLKHAGKLRTVKDAIKLPSPRLSEFAKSYGRDWVVNYLSLWIVNLNDRVNVKTKMTDVQMDHVANRVYDLYPLKITDVTLFFRRLEDGHYGELYENLSSVKLMGWVKEYFDERCETAAGMSQSNPDNFSMGKDKIDPKVAEVMFGGVGEEKIKHKTEGFGSKTRESLEVDPTNTPIQDRRVYLELLTETCKQAKYKDLIASRNALRETKNEPDALEIIERELQARGYQQTKD